VVLGWAWKLNCFDCSKKLDFLLNDNQFCLVEGVDDLHFVDFLTLGCDCRFD